MGSRIMLPDSIQPLINSPLDISGCIGWWDASTLSLSDGDLVLNWPDLSSGPIGAFTQSTQANQPTYKTNQKNGKPALLFNGAQNLLSQTFPSIPQPWTLFCVAAPKADPTPNCDIISSYPVNGPFLLRARQAGYYTVSTGKNGVNSYPLFNAGISDGTAKIISLLIRGGTPGDNNLLKFRVNSAEWSTDGMGLTATPTQFAVGGAGSPYYLYGLVMEIVLYNRALSASEIASVERFLA